jgi:hypothetical protein
MVRRFLFLVDGKACGSRRKMRIRAFYRKAANNAKPVFCRAGFQADMAGSVARIFRIAVLAAVRCSISTRSTRKSTHERSPPDSGLVQKSDGEHSLIGARQIEFAASLPLVGNHGLIQ